MKKMSSVEMDHVQGGSLFAAVAVLLVGIAVYLWTEPKQRTQEDVDNECYYDHYCPS